MSAAIGLLGGTFDPVHYAHLRLALEALEYLPVASIRWIPSGQPGHRGVPGAGVDDRLAMLRIATSAETRFVIDEADARDPAPTYTVNTLSRLRAQLGATAPLVLIIGADQLLALHTWREWRRLFEMAHIAVAERPGYEVRSEALDTHLAAEVARRSADAAALAGTPAGCLTRFGMTALDISASAIRESIVAGRTPRYLLPDGVLDYIASHQLYGSGGMVSR